jgi:nucleoside-diphosphate-sugar epimerase
MERHIVVSGCTGDLGKRIVKSLVKDGASVSALIRAGSALEKSEAITSLGAQPVLIDPSNVEEIARACKGADCVVSALAGLRDVIVDAQKTLLDGAVKAGVPRFIPSDFSTDYTRLPAGENRNFDLRREFHEILDVASIASTSIFCGCFAEVLNWSIPVLDFKNKTVGYFGSPNHLLDFTTMDNTAAFTSAVALDSVAPKILHIASFQVTPNDLVQFTAETLGAPYKLVNMGSVEDLRARNKAERAANPAGENELYARWQQSQYMQSMFSTTHSTLDNARYSNLQWTPLLEAVILRP